MRTSVTLQVSDERPLVLSVRIKGHISVWDTGFANEREAIAFLESQHFDFVNNEYLLTHYQQFGETPQ